MKIFKKTTTIDFMRYRKLSGVVSISVVVLSLLALFVFKLNFGIDFTGGTQFTIQYKHSVDINKIRRALAQEGLKKFEVKYYGTSRDVQIYISPDAGEAINKKLQAGKPQSGGKKDTGKPLRESRQRVKRDFMLALLKKHTSPDVEIRDDAYIGSQVGKELTEDGGMALLTALLVILIYVALRFEYRFAIGSVAALAHDVIVVLGIFAVTRMEFNLSVLAALLAVIGYSLNDTIVVFDRIRENFKKIRTDSSVEVVNVSINETLSRTIMTSLTTLLVLIALLFLGGESIRGFSIALILGVLVGTYSSIFVASNAALQLGVSRVDMLPVKKEGAEFDNRP